MPVYFVQSSQITGQQVRITGELAHHLRTVLRFKVGDSIDIVDEHRKRYRVSLDHITAGQLRAQILEVEEPISFSTPEIVLAQAVLKGPKMDWVVQKATELGVSEMVPIVTERTVALPPPNRASRQCERWSKIAMQASQQSSRLDIPKIGNLTPLTELFSGSLYYDLKVILWEKEQGNSFSTVLSRKKRIQSILLLIGPEGGFSTNEFNQAVQSDFTGITLGHRILRSETAVLAALTILQYELGDMK